MIGINDLLHGASSESVLREHQRLIENLKNHHPHSDIILQSILPHGGEASTWEGRDRLLQLSNTTIESLNSQLKELAEREGIYYLDLWPVFIDGQGILRSHLTTDGLHLNANGYIVWSTALQLFTQWKEQQKYPSEFNPNLAQTEPGVWLRWQQHLKMADNLNRNFP